MSSPVKKLAVRYVKPVVSDRAWAYLKNPRDGFPPEPATPAPTLESKNLTQLAKHFRTDKWGTHRYTPHYERHLQHLRHEKFTLFEIGIGGHRGRKRVAGASLRMWKEFFPYAQIVGLDIEDRSFVDEDRLRTYVGSQDDPKILDRILDDAGGEIQVIIDDGSHRPEHIRASFAFLYPRLAHDGIYVIEDTQTSYWPEWGGAEDRHDPNTSMALVKDLVDGLNHEEFVDDAYEPTYTDLHVVGVHAYHNIVFIEKGENREGTRRRKILRDRYAAG